MNTTYLELLNRIKKIEENMIEINDIFPIGSYIETSNKDFDPNIVWKDTKWEQDSCGYVTVGANPDKNVLALDENLVDLDIGETFGETKHQLLIKEMPEHKHTVNGNYGRDIGKGGWGATLSNYDYGYIFAPESITNYLNYTGENQPHNNIQPSIGVRRWHRVA